MDIFPRRRDRWTGIPVAAVLYANCRDLKLDDLSWPSVVVDDALCRVHIEVRLAAVEYLAVLEMK
jgi:hypothetical protein